MSACTGKSCSRNNFGSIVCFRASWLLSGAFRSSRLERTSRSSRRGYWSYFSGVLRGDRGVWLSKVICTWLPTGIRSFVERIRSFLDKANDTIVSWFLSVIYLSVNAVTSMQWLSLRHLPRDKASNYCGANIRATVDFLSLMARLEVTRGFGRCTVQVKGQDDNHPVQMLLRRIFSMAADFAWTGSSLLWSCNKKHCGRILKRLYFRLLQVYARHLKFEPDKVQLQYILDFV